MDFWKYLPIIMRLAPLAGQLVDHLKAGTLVQFLKDKGGRELWDGLLEIASLIWPGLAPEQAVQAAVLRTFDHSTVRTIQDGLNRLGQKPALVVDGDYGMKTKAAVEAFQKSRSLEVDGWGGPQTQAVLQADVAKLETK